MRLQLLFATAGLLASTLMAHADATGTSVTGSLGLTGSTANYFDPTYGMVPAGDGNASGTTVSIGPGVEFGYQDADNVDTADFTGSTLTISDITSAGSSPWEMTFSDPAFTGFTELSGSNLYTYTFSGDTLNISFAGTRTAPSTDLISFGYTDDVKAVTPEPSSLTLLATGLVGTLGAVRRRTGRRA